MKIYADTSVLIAWFHPADVFAPPVTAWCRAHGPDFSWNSLLRIEVRHNLRRLSGKYASVAWHAYRASETTRRILLGRERLDEVLELADELSARHVSETACGTWDYAHVAAALQARAAVFATCDRSQAKLAQLSGISEVKLFK
jgi:predicted nucleic acid-binding protein